MQQTDIVNDAGEVLMLDGFTSQANDNAVAPGGRELGNGMADTLTQVSTPFLHGKPSVNGYSNFLYFYALLRRNASGQPDVTLRIF